MPIVQVHLLSGRSTEQKRLFIEQVAAVAVRTLAVPEHAVTILLTEVQPDSWGTGARTMADIRAERGAVA